MNRYMEKAAELKTSGGSLFRSTVQQSEVLEAPKRGRPAADVSIRKKQVGLVVRPDIYEDIMRIAYVKRITVSSILEDVFKQYIKEHTRELEIFDQLQNNREDS